MRGQLVVVGGLDDMMRERIAEEWNWSALVEEDSQSIALPAWGFGKTLPCVIQDGFDLFAFHPREPLEEVLNASAIFEILEERKDRHAGPSEDPRTTDPFRRTLDFQALRPI